MADLGHLRLHLSASLGQLRSDLAQAKLLAQNTRSEMQASLGQPIDWGLSKGLSRELVAVESMFASSLKRMEVMGQQGIQIRVGLDKGSINDAIVEMQSAIPDLKLGVSFDKRSIVDATVEIQGVIADINKSKIRVQVDDSALTRLNAHYALKWQHHDETIRRLAKPIVLQVDDSNLTRDDGTGSRAISLEIDTTALSKQIRRSIEDAFDGAGEKLEKQVSKGLKKSKGNPISNAVFAAPQAVMRGFQEGIGHTYAQRVTQGTIKAIEQQFEMSLDRIGQRIGTGSAKAVQRVGGRLLQRAGFEDIGQLKGRVDEANQVLKDLIPTDILEKKLVKLENSISRVFDGLSRMRPMAEQMGNVSGVTSAAADFQQVPQHGLKRRREKKVAEYAQQIKNTPAGEHELPEGTHTVVIASGGFAGAGGKSSGMVATKVGALLGEGYHVVPVNNTATDVSMSLQDAGIGRWLAEAGAKIAGHNVVSGVNPDGVSMAALGQQYRQQYPGVKIKYAGFSAGGFAAHDALMVDKAAGYNDGKALSIGTPIWGKNHKPSDDYAGVLREEDGVKTLVDRLSPVFGGIDKRVKITPGKDHDLALYLSEPNSQRKILDQLATPETPLREDMLHPEAFRVLSHKSDAHALFEQVTNLSNNPIKDPKLAKGVISQTLAGVAEIRSELKKTQPALTAMDAELEAYIEALNEAEKLLQTMLRTEKPTVEQQRIELPVSPPRSKPIAVTVATNPSPKVEKVQPNNTTKENSELVDTSFIDDLQNELVASVNQLKTAIRKPAEIKQIAANISGRFNKSYAEFQGLLKSKAPNSKEKAAALHTTILGGSQFANKELTGLISEIDEILAGGGLTVDQQKEYKNARADIRTFKRHITQKPEIATKFVNRTLDKPGQTEFQSNALKYGAAMGGGSTVVAALSALFAGGAQAATGIGGAAVGGGLLAAAAPFAIPAAVIAGSVGLAGFAGHNLYKQYRQLEPTKSIGAGFAELMGFGSEAEESPAGNNNRQLKNRRVSTKRLNENARFARFMGANPTMEIEELLEQSKTSPPIQRNRRNIRPPEVEKVLSTILPSISATGVENAEKPVNRLSEGFQKLGGAARLAIVAFAGFHVATSIIPTITSLGIASVKTAAQLQDLNTSFSSVTRSQAGASAAIQQSTALSDRFGYNKLEGLQSDVGFRAATKDTALESVAGDISGAVTQYGRVLGVSSDRLHLTKIALQQMAGKGIQAEEVFGQGEESMPGFSRILASGSGLTIQQLRKQMERGALNSRDVLPRFAATAYADSSTQAETASQSTSAAIGRLENSFIDLQAAAGSQILAPATAGINAVGTSTKFLSENLTNIGTLAVAGFGLATVQAIGLDNITKGVGNTFSKVSTGIANFVQAPIANLKELGATAKSVGTAVAPLTSMVVATVGIAIAIDSFKSLNDIFSNNSPIKEYADSMRSLSANTKEAAVATGNLKESKYNKDRNLFDTFDDTTQAPVRTALNATIGGGYKTSGERRADRDLINLRKGQTDSEQVISRNSAGIAPIEQEKIAQVEEQLRQITTIKATLRSTDRNALTAADQKEQQLVLQRKELEAPIFSKKSELQQAIKFNRNIVEDPYYSTSPELKQERKNAFANIAAAEQGIANLDKILGKATDATSRTRQAIEEFSNGLGNVTARIQRSKQIGLIETDKRATAINPLNTGGKEGEIFKINQQAISDELQALRTATAAATKQLEQPLYKSEVANLKDKGKLPQNLQETTDEQLTELDKIKSSPEIIELVRKIKAMRDRTDTLMQESGSQVADYQKAVAENAKSAGEYYRSATAGLQKVSIEAQSARQSIISQDLGSRYKSALLGFGSSLSNYLGAMTDALLEYRSVTQIELDRRQKDLGYQQDKIQADQRYRNETNSYKQPNITANGGTQITSPVPGVSIKQLGAGKYDQSQQFGADRRKPDGRHYPHNGLDIGSRFGVRAGSQIVAPITGTAKIISVAEKGRASYGVSVVIEAPDGTVSKSTHLTRQSAERSTGTTTGGGTVQVRAGQPIGNVAALGLKNTEDHLHQEFWRNGVAINPLSVFQGAGSSSVASSVGSGSISPQVFSAVARLIAGGEVNRPNSRAGYFERQGGALFTESSTRNGFPDFAKNSAENIGRYQVNYGDYKTAQRIDSSIKDFSPESQDKILATRLKQPGLPGQDKGWTALQSLQANPSFQNFTSFRKAAGAEWESLRDGSIEYPGLNRRDKDGGRINYMQRLNLSDQQLYKDFLRRSGLQGKGQLRSSISDETLVASAYDLSVVSDSPNFLLANGAKNIAPLPTVRKGGRAKPMRGVSDSIPTVGSLGAALFDNLLPEQPYNRKAETYQEPGSGATPEENLNIAAEANRRIQSSINEQRKINDEQAAGNTRNANRSAAAKVKQAERDRIVAARGEEDKQRNLRRQAEKDRDPIGYDTPDKQKRIADRERGYTSEDRVLTLNRELSDLNDQIKAVEEWTKEANSTPDKDLTEKERNLNTRMRQVVSIELPKLRLRATEIGKKGGLLQQAETTSIDLQNDATTKKAQEDRDRATQAQSGTRTLTISELTEKKRQAEIHMQLAPYDYKSKGDPLDYQKQIDVLGAKNTFDSERLRIEDAKRKDPANTKDFDQQLQKALATYQLAEKNARSNYHTQFRQRTLSSGDTLSGLNIRQVQGSLDFLSSQGTSQDIADRQDAPFANNRSIELKLQNELLAEQQSLAQKLADIEKERRLYKGDRAKLDTLDIIEQQDRGNSTENNRIIRERYTVDAQDRNRGRQKYIADQDDRVQASGFNLRSTAIEGRKAFDISPREEGYQLQVDQRSNYYDQQIRSLHQEKDAIIATGAAAELSRRQLNVLIDDMQRLKTTELGNLAQQFDPLNQALSAVQKQTRGVAEEFVKTGKFDFNSILVSGLNSLLGKTLDKLTTSLFQGLYKSGDSAGGAKGSGKGGGGSWLDAGISVLGSIFGFADGGTINSNPIDSALASGNDVIARGLRKESAKSGGQATMIFATVGETVLTREQSAEYRSMFPNGISGYADGGEIGKIPAQSKIKLPALQNPYSQIKLPKLTLPNLSQNLSNISNSNVNSSITVNNNGSSPDIKSDGSQVGEILGALVVQKILELQRQGLVPRPG